MKGILPSLSLAVAVCLLMSGCSRLVPVYNLHDQPIANGLALEEVRKGIKQGAFVAGWRIKEAGSGHLLGTFVKGRHRVIVDIRFTSHDYDITYNSSFDMKIACTEEQIKKWRIKLSGRDSCPGYRPPLYIHKNYRVWVAKLNQTIQRALFPLKPVPIPVPSGKGISAIVLYKLLTSPSPPCKEQGSTEPQRNAESISFESDVDQVPLKGLFLPSSGDRAIVLVHGLDSNSREIDQQEIARAYVEAGFHVLVFDLRAHGSSGGDRLGFGWDERRDVRAAVNLLLKRGFRPGKIGIHGTSYGAATALLSAAVIPEVGGGGGG